MSGRLRLQQPPTGHRIGTDAILLASCAPADFAGILYDVGAGVGAVGLAAASRLAGAEVVLVEREASLAELAHSNIAMNGFEGRVCVRHADLFALGKVLTASDRPGLLLTNPPFFEASAVRESPDDGRRAAHVLEPGTTLGDWLRACLGLLAAKGQLFAILPPAPLPDILRTLPAGCGAVTIKAVHPREDAAASRLLLRIKKGSRAPFAIAAPLFLHGAAGFLPLAARLHAGEGMPAW